MFILLGSGEHASAGEHEPRPPQARPDQVGPVATLVLQNARQRYRSILIRETEGSGLPTDLADAVVAVESGYNPKAVGKVGEVGLMQVRPQTAAMLGYKGTTASLMDPEINILYGVKYLAKAWKLAKGDVCLTLVKYRSGHGEDRITTLSLLYCRRVQSRLASLGSPLAAQPSNLIISALDAARSATDAVRQDGRTAAIAEAVRRAWAQHVTRIQIIEAKTARIMGGS